MALGLIPVMWAALLFAAMMLASEAGQRLADARRARDGDVAVKSGGAAEAGVFALLGLLIAFTFSGAALRFEGRRQLINDEANAIGTAYLRLDLLPSDAQPAIRQLFRDYVQLRASIYHNATDFTETSRRLDEGSALQNRIWTQSLAAAQRPDAPSQATMLLLPALNQMLDITTTRVTATQTHPPRAIFMLLGGLSIVAALMVGYGASPNNRRNWFHTMIFAAVLSLTVYVIIDIEYPRIGLIRIDAADQILSDLGKTMR